MILTERVLVRPCGKFKEHYLKLGYNLPAGILEVPVSELHSKSNAIVLAKCEDCGVEREVRFAQYRTFCASCSRKGVRNANWKGGLPTCVDCGVELTNRNYKDVVRKRCNPCRRVFYTGENNALRIHENHICSCGEPKHKRAETCWECYTESVYNADRVKRGGGDTLWAKRVKALALHACNICGSSEHLHAHHLQGFDKNPENRLEDDNGVCLCADCHIDFHKTYGFGDNTPEQFYEYKETRI